VAVYAGHRSHKKYLGVSKFIFAIKYVLFPCIFVSFLEKERYNKEERSYF